jgi:hypothetical protein
MKDEQDYYGMKEVGVNVVMASQELIRISFNVALEYVRDRD